MDQREELQKISAQFDQLMEEKREIIHQQEEQLKTLRLLNQNYKKKMKSLQESQQIQSEIEKLYTPSLETN